MPDRVVLITGGTGALGAAVALAVLEAGATAIVTYRDARDRDTLTERAPTTARERLHALQADVTDGESVRRLVDGATARHRQARRPGQCRRRVRRREISWQPTSAPGTPC